MKPHTPFSAQEVKSIFSSWLTARTRTRPLALSSLDKEALHATDDLQCVLGIVGAIKLYGTSPRLLLPIKEQEAYMHVMSRVGDAGSSFDKTQLRGKTVAETVALLVDFVRDEEKSARMVS